MKIYILLALLGVALVEAKVYFQETFSSEGEYKCTVIVKCMGEFESLGERGRGTGLRACLCVCVDLVSVSHCFVVVTGVFIGL